MRWRRRRSGAAVSASLLLQEPVLTIRLPSRRLTFACTKQHEKLSKETPSTSSSVSASCSDKLVRLVLRPLTQQRTHCYIPAGYSERGLASFQALVEINLFRPSALALPGPYDRPVAWRDRLLVEFESFWDTEASRIGEKGATGWKNTGDDDLPPETLPASNTDLATTPFVEPQARPHERWAATERLSSLDSHPARTTDPGTEDSDDPYRVVLFDDISPFLFVLHSADSKLQLAYAFLTFLGLPFIPPDLPTSSPFTTDPFIHSELVERPSRIQRFWPKLDTTLGKAPYEMVGGEAMEPERRSAVNEPWETPFSATPAAVDMLFATGSKGWFRTLKKEDLADVDVEVAKFVFSSSSFLQYRTLTPVCS